MSILDLQHFQFNRKDPSHFEVYFGSGAEYVLDTIDVHITAPSQPDAEVIVVMRVRLRAKNGRSFVVTPRCYPRTGKVRYYRKKHDPVFAIDTVLGWHELSLYLRQAMEAWAAAMAET